MNLLSSIRRRGLRPRLLLGILALLLAVFASPMAARAHALDVYLQATYISVAPAQVIVELDLSPGVLVAPTVLEQLDTDADQQISEAEGLAYANIILQQVVLQVDDEQQKLQVTKVDMPSYVTIQAGYGTIRVFSSAALADSMTDTHTISYTNNNSPTGVAYQVNTFTETGTDITLGTQNRDDIQQGMTVDYTLGSATQDSVTTAATGDAANTTLAGSEQARQLLGYLYAPSLSPWVLLAALGLASMLGGLHALTPGHGKTLVAAYLVGSRGTVRHAVLLGAIVTFTHTISVILIGMLALFASQFIMPSVLAPLLGVVSGLLVISMGVRLILQRWRVFRNRRNPEHTHEHSHDHQGTLTHDHGDGHTHTHLPPTGGVKLGNLVTLGVSGGLVPCPEALGIMVIAIGINRILLGLGLIVSFSFGLAAVLIVIGILLVRSRSLLERFGGFGSRWSSALPLASAALVTVLGVGITVSGLANYLS